MPLLGAEEEVLNHIWGWITLKAFADPLIEGTQICSLRPSMFSRTGSICSLGTNGQMVLHLREKRTILLAHGVSVLGPVPLSSGKASTNLKDKVR